MLFNSYPFIFLFLPVTAIVYFLLIRFRWVVAAKTWLALASLFFYGYWNVKYIPLILASIVFNYLMGRWLAAWSGRSVGQRRAVLIAGLVIDILLLGYYKYANFLLQNVGELTGHTYSLLQIVLPLGISFFTFTQIAFLVDAYKGKAKEFNFISYTLFVTFFPHLIAGPILHHSEMMPQFDRKRNKVWNWSNAARGVYVFCIGLFKKVVIADTFAIHANYGFSKATEFTDSWIAALSYTFQLYFDFSGYTDMAIGIALLFNIRLPQNFNSPYKATSITDFWRRWHMTLSRFLRDYIYIPLGGNRRGFAIANRNLIITFLIGGLWHGAGWTFILWGALHGVGQAIQRVWTRRGRPLPTWFAWFLTFLFINVTWVFFRAEDFHQAIRLLKGMAGLNGFGLDLVKAHWAPILLIIVFLPFVLIFKNSSEKEERFKPSWQIALGCAVLFIVSLLYLNRISTFLYFNF
ncbi:peptidoglycan O-acetyltransferase [Cohnella xylanilytica]|uniref:MBOAT family protein n=1 Tax=Cohnella xylanilytica TaxID=557555 RepID=A0A841TQN0_9BACL|nr:MBOAT family protein [Cohnella xylanilytica]MBB6690606.1 MBOAT family protein [Cohnella xylanilytica]GIO15056.1 peptidoglycan O-acetyltransferase [Cohnella xylanilytica]